MFDAWRKAWKDAVENFWRELDPEEARDPGRQATAMRRDLAAAQKELDRLEADLARARRQLAEEREAEESCKRRESLARGIGDDETARIATEFAARHAEHAGVLERKAEALDAERALLRRDLEAMQAAFARISPPDAAAPPLDEGEDRRDDPEFRRLEQEARERTAEQRLEELKRRMR